MANHAETLLKPLFDLRGAETLPAPARGIAFRLSENLGIVERSEIADEVKALDQDARAGLRALGVRFGAYHIYVPALLKPAPSALLATFWALKNGGLDIAGLPELARLAASGRTSVPVEAGIRAAALSRRRLQGRWQPRRAHRHSRTPRRSYPPADRMAADD